MTFSITFYKYFLIWKRLLLSLSLSLSHAYFCVIFFIFCISTLDWCIYVFFRILLCVAIWFCVFKLLSFFFSIIIKCYFIAYKYSLQEYNVILLYIMVWIVRYLTYDYIFYLILLLFFLSISLLKKVITLSLSLSLSLYIYIYIQLYFRLMNHCIFLYNTILG